MYEFKAGVMERMEQTFWLLFSRKMIIFILSTIVVFKIFTFIFFGVLESSSMKNIFGENPESFSEENAASLLGSTSLVISFLVYTTTIIIFSFFSICLQLSLIRTVKEQFNGNNELTIEENVLYGIKNLWNSMYTYYRYFLYVLIIPSIWFIVWGIFLIFAIQNGGKITHEWETPLVTYATFFLVAWVFVGWFIALYRSLQSCFFLVSAIDKDNFSRDNFQESVSVTKGKWWRVFWNFLLAWIIIGLCTSIFSGVLGIVWFAWWDGSSKLESIVSLATKPWVLENPSSTKEILKTLWSSSFWSLEITVWALKQLIDAFASSFILIFSYIFLKRLELEKREEENKKTPVEEVL